MTSREPVKDIRELWSLTTTWLHLTLADHSIGCIWRCSDRCTFQKLHSVVLWFVLYADMLHFINYTTMICSGKLFILTPPPPLPPRPIFCLPLLLTSLLYFCDVHVRWFAYISIHNIVQQSCNSYFITHDWTRILLLMLTWKTSLHESSHAHVIKNNMWKCYMLMVV